MQTSYLTNNNQNQAYWCGCKCCSLAAEHMDERLSKVTEEAEETKLHRLFKPKILLQLETLYINVNIIRYIKIYTNFFHETRVTNF